MKSMIMMSVRRMAKRLPPRKIVVNSELLTRARRGEKSSLCLREGHISYGWHVFADGNQFFRPLF